MLRKLKQFDKSPVIKTEVVTNLLASVVLYWAIMQYVPWNDYFAKVGDEQPYMMIPVEGSQEDLFVPISGLLSLLFLAAIFFIVNRTRRIFKTAVSKPLNSIQEKNQERFPQCSISK